MSEPLTGAQLMGIAPMPAPETAETIEWVGDPADPEPVLSAAIQPEIMQHVTMIDATHAHVANIPRTTIKVAGYDTGTPDIDWTAEDWARFPHAGHVIIDQSAGHHAYAMGVANVADVETGAGTIPDFVAATEKRITDGHDGWIYGARATVEYAATQLSRAQIPLGRVGAWLADWNLTEAEAVAMLGASIGGVRVIAVQWASPSSNPATMVPGGTQTLAEANVDLSVAEAAWFPPAAVGSGTVTVEQARAALRSLSAKFNQFAETVDPEMTLLTNFSQGK